jgi:hypothetical protein
VLAITLFGREVPSIGAGFLIFLVMVGIFLASRWDAGSGNVTGRGRMYECKRCGVDFQPEKVELLQTGDTRHFIDERCPHCGWDLEWGDPDKRPGGSSGSW